MRQVVSEEEKIRVAHAYLSRFDVRNGEFGGFKRTICTLYPEASQKERDRVYAAVKRWLYQRGIFSLERLNRYLTRKTTKAVS